MQEIIKEYIEKGYSTEEALEHIIELSNDMFDNEVDLSNLMKLATSLY